MRIDLLSELQWDKLWNDLMEDVFEVPLSKYPPRTKGPGRYASVDKKDDHYMIKILAPELGKDKVGVAYSKERLNIKLDYGETNFWGDVQTDYSIFIPDADVGSINPTLKNGVLIIRVGIAKKEQTQKFHVN